MSANDEIIMAHLECASKKVIQEFSSNSIDFLYESDLQSLLYAELRNAMRGIRYPSQAKDIKEFFNCTDINPVKTEYRLNIEGINQRFDIAVLAADHDPAFRIWWQRCRVGIEIKLWQPDGTGAGPWQDIEKLRAYHKECQRKQYAFTGISMVFVHPGAEKWISKYIHDTKPDIHFPSNGVTCHIISVDCVQTVHSPDRA